MNKRHSADAVIALYTVAHIAGTCPDEIKLPHFNHLLARLAEIGLRFEDVVEGGMMRAFALRSRDINDAWERQPLALIVSTESWKFHASFYLSAYKDLLTHRDRTYLEMIQTREALLANDMLELEQVLRRAFEAAKSVKWGEQMEEFRAVAGEASPAEQIDLDI